MTKNSYATMGTTPAGFQVAGVDMNQLVITSTLNSAAWDLSSRFAVSDNVTFRWGSGGCNVTRLGNENQSGVRYISIIGLKAGNQIELTCSNTLFYSTNVVYGEGQTVAKDGEVTSGTVYTVVGDGTQNVDLYMASRTWANITKVVVKRTVECAEPTKTITGVNGVKRKFTLDCATEGATIYYATSELEKGAEGWTEYTSEVETDVDIIYAYATNGSSTSDIISFSTGAGTTVVLNEPIFTVTNYANKQYTVSISSNQIGVDLNPVASIYYRIGESGDYNAYSTPVDIDEGETIYAYTVCAGYENSAVASYRTAVRPTFVTVWSLDFANQATEDKGTVTIGEEELFSVGGVSFYSITANNFTSNSNFGVVDNHSLLLRTNSPKGLYSQASGGRAIGIANLKEGQYVRIKCDANSLSGETGAAKKDADLSTDTELYYKATEDGNLSITQTRNTYIQSVEVLDTKVSSFISPAGYSTFSSEYALDVTGLSAYYVTADGIDKNTVILTEATGTVQANTGLILKGKANEEITIPVAEAGSELEGNLLVAVTEETNAPAGSYVFAYSKDDPAGTAGFYSVGSEVASVPAGKAYLSKSASEAKVLRIVFGDENPTAIEAVAAETEADGTLYNVAGQQVGSDYKGIVIKNGKKYLTK